MISNNLQVYFATDSLHYVNAKITQKQSYVELISHFYCMSHGKIKMNFPKFKGRKKKRFLIAGVGTIENI